MINKKGLSDKEINKLIDKELEWKEYYNETWLPMYVQTEAMKIYMKGLDSLSLKKPKEEKIDDFEAIFAASEDQRRKEESAGNLNSAKGDEDGS